MTAPPDPGDGNLMTEPPLDITKMLAAWTAGDRDALDRLLPLVYGELRRLARNRLRLERPGQSLQPTALVNEAYVRLVRMKRLQWQNRAHFFALCARLMRHILVDAARARKFAKRAGGGVRITLNEALLPGTSPDPDVVALDDALAALEEMDPRKSRVVGALAIGSHLGPYRVTALLGSGGMGEVYRAHDLRLDRNVALKILPDGDTHDPSVVERFTREARAASALNHPNIVTIHEIGETETAHFYIMQLV